LGNIEQLIRIECPDSNSVNGAQPEWLHCRHSGTRTKSAGPESIFADLWLWIPGSSLREAPE